MSALSTIRRIAIGRQDTGAAAPTVSRRAAALPGVAVSALAALLLAGCGSGGGSGSGAGEAAAGTGTAGGAETPATDGAFPVTIDHALGTTVIEESPERVVTLGWASQDTALALGVTPVGVPLDGWAGDPGTGLLPWTELAVEELGTEMPATVVDLPEVDVEAVAALQPDLILATYSGITQEVYDQLSQLAPTVAYPDQPWLTPWRDQTLVNGRALGKEAEAQEVVAGMEEQIEHAAEENPSLAGKTFAYVYATPEGTLSAYVEGDPRVDLLTGLGMELTPGVAALDVPEGTFFADLGTESTDVLADADVLIAWFNDAEQQAAVEALGTFSAIPAVQRGSYVPVLDRRLTMAMSTTTALSLPWALDAFVPELVAAAEAADGA